MSAAIRSLPSPSKKRKVEDKTDFATSTKRLEDELTRAISNDTSLNSLADLLDHALITAHDDAQKTSKAIYALYRVFVLLITHKKFSLAGDEAGKVVKAWLWEQLNTYVEFLGGLMKDEEKTLRVSFRFVLHAKEKKKEMMISFFFFCVDLFVADIVLPFKIPVVSVFQYYNLDYPQFYTRLYAFLDKDVLHIKHRARFFRMVELFLSSSHLPALILASFVKRLSRLSLSAPPAAIVMVIPFTYNILKRHPVLMTMIHRTTEEEEEEEGEEPIMRRNHSDPFLAEEMNPLLTQALSSSLWELYSHRVHYHSTVSTLGKILSEAFTKPGYVMEDFLDHTYHTLFDTEIKRKVIIKKEPALAMGTPGALVFPMERVTEDGVEADVITQFWTFFDPPPQLHTP
ncbi:hypothetical protein APHAL10511_003473 [Amanita phalloides]|nr:hypothetical protein APHAL10511_003473 [Amanita phalloides]